MRAADHLLLVGLVFAASACTEVDGLLDFCDGADDDGDGMIDEGTGAAAGCDDDEICVAGRCQYECGDRVCQSSESCSSCTEDCGACPACGDGACNGTETCTACAGDCGACPSCGDGDCNADETCISCRVDCGACPGECGLCDSSFECSSGMTCGQRRCDGAIACFAGSNPCAVIDGDECGALSAWERCTGFPSGSCGPRMVCWGTTGVERCQPSYNSDATECPLEFRVRCPYAPVTDPPPPICVATFSEGPGSWDYYCRLPCRDGSDCPFDMVCTEGRCTG